jgi:hypothetical protein
VITSQNQVAGPAAILAQTFKLITLRWLWGVRTRSAEVAHEALDDLSRAALAQASVLQTGQEARG